MDKCNSASNTGLKFFFIIFTLSGFSGLIYESIWSHYLKLFLGHAAYAQTLVLAIFMGGMAIGSAICARRSERWHKLLLAYAIIEAVIGVLALFFHELFDALIFQAYEVWIPAIGNPLTVQAFKWGISALLILPQSVLLGMTFPLISAGLIRRFQGHPGEFISTLYFCNSIGAAAGVLVSGFIMLDLLGLPGTIRAAGLMNLLLALSVWFYLRKFTEARPETQQPAPSADAATNRYFLFFLLIAFVTGAASFIYEISWIRMLGLVLGSSTHAFELMLSAFILGLALGGLWIRLRIGKIRNVTLYLAMVQLAMGILALLTLPTYNVSFELMQWLVQVLEKTNAAYVQFNLSTHGIAMLVMLPATICAGMTLPLLTYLLLQKGVGEKSIGAVYASNTLGAIAGVFFATHVGLPLLGLKGLLFSGAALDIILALAIALLLLKETGNKSVYAIAGIGLVFLLSISMFSALDPHRLASGVYRHGRFLSPQNAEIAFHRDGKAASIDLIRFPDNGHVTISTNGKPDATINMSGKGPASPDEATMVLAAAIPLALNPQARVAGVIGMGSGLTTNTLLLSDAITRVDTVEIEAAVVDAAQGFRPRVDLAYTSPKSQIFIDDAKTYFSTHNRKYDIIVSEPSNPWVSGTASLFTREFYRLIKTHMNEGGLLVQWLQLYEIDMPLVATVVKALSSEFSHYRLYATDDEDLVFVASMRPVSAELSFSALQSPRLKEELWAVGVRHAQDLRLHEIGDKAALDPLFQSYILPANSDYYPVLDLNAARTRFLQKHAGEIVDLPQYPLPLLHLLSVDRRESLPGQVTPNPYLKRSEQVFAASLIRDFLVSDRVHSQYERIEAKTRQAVETVRSRLILCQPAGSSLSIDSISHLAAVTMPALSLAESRRIWGRTITSACFHKLDLSVQQWLALLYSMSSKNAIKMNELALSLLKHNEFNQLQKAYLVQSAMLANLLLNNKQAARDIWQEHGHGINPDQDLGWRLLLAHAGIGM